MDAVSVTLFPAQILKALALTVGAGGAFTDTVEVAVAVTGKPAAKVTVTVYVVVDAGFTPTVDVVIPPGFHE